MAHPEDLRRLAVRTRELAEELDRARPDLLSVTELNRALRHILGTQAAILEALARVDAASALSASASASRPQIRVSSRDASPASHGGKRPLEPVELRPDELLDDPILDLDEADAKLPATEFGKEPAPQVPASEAPTRTLPAVGPADLPAGPVNGAAPANGSANGASAATAAPPPGTSYAEAWLNEKRTVPSHLARQFVCQFDNRDKDYDKGLDKLNRWVAAGSAGTPFQWRGDQAYLSLSGAAASSIRNYEDQLMTRMGFSRRLGRLDVPGLEGEIVIYERPS